MNRAGSLRRSLRSRAVRLVRRSRLLPRSWPDRLGDEERLAGVSLDQPVLVYFPDPGDKLYQLRQWYGPLRALHARHPVVVVGQDSRAMAAVRAESGLTAVTVARYDFMAELLERSSVKVVLYVNHSTQNFGMLRFPTLAHVYLSHGDSDKGVSVSNQVKAYDWLFVAGQAAVDRLVRHLMFTDIAARCVPIGRPELDSTGGPVPRTDSRRPRVLYAPTWEGAQPSMAYSSLTSLGEQLVTALVASDRFSVTYRPHPLTGTTDPAYAAADRRIRAVIALAADRDPAARHRVDGAQPLPQSFADADVLVCDVSAVAMDWLSTARPLLVTTPSHPDVVTVPTRLLEVVPRLAAGDVGRVIELVAAQVDDDPSQEQRLALIEYYLGSTAAGAATERFLDACSRVIEQLDQARAALSSTG